MHHLESSEGRSVIIGWDEYNHRWYVESSDPLYVRSFDNGSDLNEFLIASGFRYVHEQAGDEHFMVDWSGLVCGQDRDGAGGPTETF